MILVYLQYRHSLEIDALEIDAFPKTLQMPQFLFKDLK